MKLLCFIWRPSWFTCRTKWKKLATWRHLIFSWCEPLEFVSAPILVNKVNFVTVCSIAVKSIVKTNRKCSLTIYFSFLTVLLVQTHCGSLQTNAAAITATGWTSTHACCHFLKSSLSEAHKRRKPGRHLRPSTLTEKMKNKLWSWLQQGHIQMPSSLTFYLSMRRWPDKQSPWRLPPVILLMIVMINLGDTPHFTLLRGKYVHLLAALAVTFAFSGINWFFLSHWVTLLRASDHLMAVLQRSLK